MVNLICAVSQNGYIGNNNELLVRIPEDLRYFKSLTQNNIVIMGRKTFESIGNKPLPNRMNIVISNTLEETESENLIILNDIDKVFEIIKTEYGNKDIFIIGGNKIYSAFSQYVNKIYLTWIYQDFWGDTKFPFDKFCISDWKVVSCSKLMNHDGIDFAFFEYEPK